MYLNNINKNFSIFENIFSFNHIKGGVIGEPRSPKRERREE
jgi:hypothetical protein